jgi:hypothetical protein
MWNICVVCEHMFVYMDNYLVRYSLVIPYRAWFLKLWYAYHYWYADHCLLVRGLNKKIEI